MKKIISLLLTMCMCFSITCLPKKVEAAGFLSDELADKFINLFYSEGGDVANKARRALVGKEEMGIDIAKDIIRRSSFVLGTIVDFDSLSYADQISLTNISEVTKCANAAIGIVSNWKSMLTSSSAMQKTVDAIQVLSGFSNMWGFSIPSSVNAAYIAVELALEVSSIVQKSILRDYEAWFRAEMEIAKVTGEFPSPIGYVKVTNELYGYTQEDVDAVFSAIFFEYYIDMMLDELSKIKTYTITYDSNCPEVLDYSYIYCNVEGNWHVPEMERSGYVFAGWYWDENCTEKASVTAINGDSTFYAKWLDRYHTITYKSNCEEIGDFSYVYDLVYDNWIDDYEPPQREKYEFVGWYWDEECTNKASGTETTVNRDLTFYAKWQKCVFDITYDSNCDYVDDMTVEFDIRNNENTVVPTMKRNGYIFAGWYWDKECKNEFKETSTVESDLTFYAKWVPQFAFSISDKGLIINEFLCYLVVDGEKVTDIVVPETIDGYTVVSSGEGAFEQTGITSIQLPDTIISIETDAFRSSELQSINLPNNLITIGDSAFCGSKLKSINLPVNLKIIGNQAFASCDSITNVYIPRNVESIGAGSFERSGLEKITVDKENQFYIADDNIVYNKDKTSLILYPSKKSQNYFAIPEGVESIGERAFSWAENLAQLSFPNSLDTIGNNAFLCVPLKNELFIPDSVKKIGDHAFSGTKIERVRIPAMTEMNEYGMGSFTSCSELREIEIAEGAKQVYLARFVYLCPKLEKLIVNKGVQFTGSIKDVDIYYKGSQIDWRKAYQYIASNSFSYRKITMENVNIYYDEHETAIVKSISNLIFDSNKIKGTVNFSYFVEDSDVLVALYEGNA